MPCNCDYLEQRPDERYRQETAKLLLYVKDRLDLPVSPALIENAHRAYTMHDYTEELCDLLKNIDDETFETIVYNAKNADSRRLATWWENHVENDKKREVAEAEERRKDDLIKSGLSKLTPDEIGALGIRLKKAY